MLNDIETYRYNYVHVPETYIGIKKKMLKV